MVNNVVQFRSRDDNSIPSARAKPKTSCCSPIIVERYDRSIVSLLFHKSFFNIPHLEIALRCLAFGSVWDLYKPENEPSRIYVTYHIALKKEFGKSTDDVLVAIVDRIIKKAYLKEMRLRSNEVEIADLVKPRQYTLGDGANISARTKTVLMAAGMRTAEDLAEKTREDLCQIPGMSTEEIVRLEKSLAVRGIFLRTQVPNFS
ncbi:helix-hairpin-helix domain-containing protein [Candidatus Saccharibacteria bacterium]|nr:helix-hairpin-helix domain-containing protein [Candidatus Saccharibacteria bacterium]